MIMRAVDRIKIYTLSLQGPEDCRDKTMVSTIQKPMEHCELQPQRHCSLVTKLVPHLTTREVCKVIPKEICVLKLVNPHPVKKPITLKWCTKKKPANLPSYAPPSSASNSYLPPKSAPPQYQPPPLTSYKPTSNHLRREGTGTEEDPFIITVDGEKFAELNTLPQDFNSILSGPGPSRQTRDPDTVSVAEFNQLQLGGAPPPGHAPFRPSAQHHHTGPRQGGHHRHGPGRGRHPAELLDTAGSDVSVSVVTSPAVSAVSRHVAPDVISDRADVAGVVHVVTPAPAEGDTSTEEPLHIVKVDTLPYCRQSKYHRQSNHSDQIIQIILASWLGHWTFNIGCG